MAKSGTSKTSGKGAGSSTLMVRLDAKSKEDLARAARLRQISVSDYVRAVIVPQARREIESARRQTIALTPEEQVAFWNALAETPKLTAAQKRLGKLMRGSR
jgi:uncharacterized protein (DUF1778 family)